MTRTGRKYFSEVKKQVLVRGNQRKMFLLAIESRIVEFAQSHPEATVEDFCREIGKPEEVGASQLMELSYEEIHQRMRGGARALKGLAALAITVLLVLGLTVAYLVIDNEKDQNGFMQDYIQYAE